MAVDQRLRPDSAMILIHVCNRHLNTFTGTSGSSFFVLIADEMTRNRLLKRVQYSGAQLSTRFYNTLKECSDSRDPEVHAAYAEMDNDLDARIDVNCSAVNASTASCLPVNPMASSPTSYTVEYK